MRPNVEQALLRVADGASLTPAQTEMLLAMACGLSYTDISELRLVSRQATKQLALAVFDGLGVRSRSELMGALSRLNSLAWDGHSPEALVEFLLARFGHRPQVRNASAPAVSATHEPVNTAPLITDSEKAIRSRKPMLLALGALVVLAATVVFVAPWPDQGDSQPTGSNFQLAETEDGRPLESGLCLARGLEQSVIDDLTRRSAAGGAGEEPFAAFATTLEEAESVLAFPAVAPAVPDGWAIRLEIKPESPVDGLNGYCYLRVFLDESPTSQSVGFSGAGLQKVEVEIRAAHPDFSPFTETPSGPGRSVTMTTINGKAAELLTRDYDQPSVLISWQNDTTYLRVACSSMTSAECLAVAETTG